MIDELLVSFLRSNEQINALADEIAVGEVPEDADGNPLVKTWIWIEQYSEDDSLDLDGDSGLTEYHFDCECCSLDNAKAKRLGRLVKKLIQGHAGDFGTIEIDGVTKTGSVQGTFVEDKDEDYERRNDFGDTDITVIALDLQVFADDAQDDFQGDM